MRDSPPQFRRFRKVPTNGSINFWVDRGRERPDERMYDEIVDIGNHIVVVTSPKDRGTIVACYSCQKGIEVDVELDPLVKKYLFGYFATRPCA